MRMQTYPIRPILKFPHLVGGRHACHATMPPYTVKFKLIISRAVPCSLLIEFLYGLLEILEIVKNV